MQSIDNLTSTANPPSFSLEEIPFECQNTLVASWVASVILVGNKNISWPFHQEISLEKLTILYFTVNMFC